MCLLTTLSTFYPSFMFLFQLSMTIDISCHWLHVHTALLQVMSLTDLERIFTSALINPSFALIP